MQPGQTLLVLSFVAIFSLSQSSQIKISLALLFRRVLCSSQWFCCCCLFHSSGLFHVYSFCMLFRLSHPKMTIAVLFSPHLPLALITIVPISIHIYHKPIHLYSNITLTSSTAKTAVIKNTFRWTHYESAALHYFSEFRVRACVRARGSLCFFPFTSVWIIVDSAWIGLLSRLFVVQLHFWCINVQSFVCKAHI